MAFGFRRAALATTASLVIGASAIAGLVAYSQTVQVAGTMTQGTIPQRADNFRLVDQSSKAHELYYYKNASAIVLIAYAGGSEHLAAAAPALKAMKSAYAEKGVRFFLLNASQTADRKAVAAEMAALGLDIPVLLDDAQLVSEHLGVSRAAEAFVIDPKGWRIAYNGPIDNRFAGKSPKPKASVKPGYVAAALDSLIAGQPVAVSTAKLDSPLLSFPERARKDAHAKISYSDQVGPILAANCVACHSEGGIGPFAMTSYETVKGFAPMIREAIRTDRMPPYNADPHVGEFKGDMNLSVTDMKTLVHWIEAGAPRGEGADPLKINAKPAPEWELGTPDYIITLPSYVVPASGVVDYQNPVVKNLMAEGRWLRAATIKPSDRQAVHHLLSNGVGGYAVGAETTVAPEGTGTWVEAGQEHRFQMHYTPYGKESTETTRVGLYFYPKDKPPEVVRRSVVVLNAGIQIPAGAARHEEVAYITFPEDATLYSIYPHAHYRGENMAVFLQRPGAEEEMILSLPKYDFNWQRGYEFKQPLSVPKGSKVITRYQYDNSKDNPANPDPTINVTWGEQSWEEMQYTALSFRWNDETVANQKPDYMNRLNASRLIGMMDVNFDDRVAKTEVRGRMAQMITANFDKLDADKDGYLSIKELEVVGSRFNRRIEEAAAQQSVGQ